MRINNLTIRFSNFYRKWQVRTPDKRILEEFSRKQDAIDFAKRTKDFVVKR